MAFLLEDLGGEYTVHSGRDYAMFPIDNKPYGFPVSHLEKNGERQDYFFCAGFDSEERWIVFDVHELPDFDLEIYEKIRYFSHKRAFVAEFLQKNKLDFDFLAKLVKLFFTREEYRAGPDTPY